MMSRTSPVGPWEAPSQDIIACTNYAAGVVGPGHGCVFHPKGSSQWYLVTLEFGRGGTTRQIYAHKMYFNADGTIQPVQLSLNGVGAIGRDNAYGEPNLALGQSATASSTQPDFKVPHIPGLIRIENYAPGNAIDGSNGSRWLAASGDTAPWYQVDLGKTRQIRQTELNFVNPTAGHAYKLEYSLDGTNWQLYGDHEDVVVESPHIDVKSIRARFLKVTILQGTPGLWEFKVY
jgi:hypothetical protein